MSSRAFAVFLAALLVVPLPSPVAASTYLVGSGDQLFVDFPLRGTATDLQALNGNGLQLVIVGEQVFFRYTATVAPDGYISLPSLDPLPVNGLTLEQVREEITKHLKSFSLRDTVSVILAHPNSQAFVVAGEVQHPGRFIYERPTSLMEALAIAGGTTDHAQLKRVMLFRMGQPMLKLDVSDKRLREQGPPLVSVMPSDTLVIPRRWFTPDNVMILILLSTITTAASVYAATRY